MQRHVFRCIKRKLQSHVRQRLGDVHATVKIHTPFLTACSHIGLGTFGGHDVEFGVHWVAGKLDVTTVLNGEGLERYDGKRIFHLSVVEGIFSCKAKLSLGIVRHAQTTSANQIDIIGMVGVEITHHMRSLVDVHGHVHIES